VVHRSAVIAPELLETAGPGMRKANRLSSKPPSLIEMDEVILDGNELQNMLGMLSRRAEHIVVRVKKTADSGAHEASSLAELSPLLLRKEIFGAQVQYSYGPARWLDTLVVTREGIRLVRVQLG
jgi:hypothetical protein